MPDAIVATAISHLKFHAPLAFCLIEFCRIPQHINCFLRVLVVAKSSHNYHKIANQHCCTSWNNGGAELLWNVEMLNFRRARNARIQPDFMTVTLDTLLQTTHKMIAKKTMMRVKAKQTCHTSDTLIANGQLRLRLRLTRSIITVLMVPHTKRLLTNTLNYFHYHRTIKTHFN